LVAIGCFDLGLQTRAIDIPNPWNLEPNPVTQITFLVGSFHPNFSAVGYCAYQVQRCLADKFDISTIAFRDEPSQPLEDRLDAIRVHRIETPRMRARGIAQGTSGLGGDARRIALRVKGAVRRLFSSETVDHSLVCAYQARLEAMDPRPEVIVPVVFPFEAALAALAFKRDYPEVYVIPYLFDDFVDSGSLHVLKLARAIKRRRHLHLERRMLKNADAVLAMKPLRAHFEQYFHTGLLDKITYLEHPLLTRPSRASSLRYDNGVTRLCYTGALVKNVRDPDYLLSILHAMQTKQHVQADFYVMGNAAAKIPSETSRGSVKIINHGWVPKSEADAAVQGADILLNIGEMAGKQISSKVFEYLASGKPIVHLAYVPEDSVTRILSKYPLALCLVQEQKRFKENVHLFSEFVAKKRHDILTFDAVKHLYPEALPETTAIKLGSLVRRICHLPAPHHSKHSVGEHDEQ
jgi:glycosyltransferase involved in cell wall biosynthesis